MFIVQAISLIFVNAARSLPKRWKMPHSVCLQILNYIGEAW